MDERGFSVLGGDADAIRPRTQEGLARASTSPPRGGGRPRHWSGPDRVLPGARPRGGGDLERSNGRRCFRRLDDEVEEPWPTGDL